MSVHNSVHDSVHNSDDDDKAHPNPVVTLISKLDLSHPLHLHPNDSSTLTVVSIKLKGTENYNVWSCAMLLALEGRNKTGFIDNTCRSEESHRAVVIGSRVGSSQRTQSSMFNSNVNNRGGAQTSQTFGDTSRPNNVPRPNNNRNRRVAGGLTLVCEYYRFNGHTIDRCFKLIGYPADFEKRMHLLIIIKVIKTLIKGL
nr:ribonuclease H-like domain-containing protein [Tanacetum cinerariifolium]